MTGRRWRRGLRSVRGRTTALAALLVAVTLVVGAVVLVTSLTGALVRGGDAAALTRVRDVAELAAAGALPASLAVPADDDLVQVVAADGTVLAAGGVATRAGARRARAGRPARRRADRHRPWTCRTPASGSPTACGA